MAKKFLSAIQLLTVGADPVTASAGDLYFNNTSNLVKYFDGTNWVAVPKNLSNLQDVSFDGVEGGNVLSFNSSTNKWENTIPTQAVDVGPTYPTTGLQNGQLFYNSLENRFAIYYDDVWRELAYYPDTLNIDGGDSATQIFGLVLDGGNSFTTTFINLYDCGNATGFPDEPTIDGGNSATTVFAEIFDGGISNSTEFEPIVDGGNSV
jgi:hypothetical protein